MKTKQILYRMKNVSFAIGLGLLSTLILMVGMALAQSPELGVNIQKGQQKATYWLILDLKTTVDEILPALVDRLTMLKETGVIMNFNPVPQTSTSTAVPGIQVIARPGIQNELEGMRLPGILTVNDSLPPPPPVNKLGILSASGSITGRITAQGTGQPITNSTVTFYDAVSFAYIGSSSTNSSGYYTTTTLIAPYNQVKIYAGRGYANSNDSYTPEWYDNKPFFSEATSIAMTGNVETNKNIQLAWRGTGVITGTITVNGTALITGQKTSISFYNFNTNEYQNSLYFNFNGNGNQTVYSQTVPAGTYRVSYYYQDYSQSEYYNSTNSRSQATPVIVTDGATTPNINSNLVTNPGASDGVITGTITINGNPLTYNQNVSINYNDFDTGRWKGYFSFSGDGRTTVYTKAIPAGIYKVSFFGDTFAYSEYYSGTTWSNADPVTVITGTTTPNINANMRPMYTGGISGTVLTPNGLPVQNGKIQVYKYNWYGSPEQDTYFYNGRYQVNNLEPGEYQVSFSKFPSATTWYNNSQLSRFKAMTVTVVASNTTPNINGTLLDKKGACITGKIVDSQGQPISRANYTVYDWNNEEFSVWEGIWGSHLRSWSYADADGTVVACGLSVATITTGDVGVTAGTTYTINAQDGNGNYSSTTVTITTAGETVSFGTISFKSSVYLPIIIK